MVLVNLMSCEAFTAEIGEDLAKEANLVQVHLLPIFDLMCVCTLMVITAPCC